MNMNLSAAMLLVIVLYKNQGPSETAPEGWGAKSGLLAYPIQNSISNIIDTLFWLCDEPRGHKLRI